MKACNHCGAKNKDDAKFCSVCGEEITEKIAYKPKKRAKTKAEGDGLLINVLHFIYTHIWWIFMIGIMVLCFLFYSYFASKEEKEETSIRPFDETVANSDLYNTTSTSKLVKNSEYAYMSNEYHVYIAKVVSEDMIKVELWKKSSKSDKTMVFDKEVGLFSINDENNGFQWIDKNNSTAFRFRINDEVSSDIKKISYQVFTINIYDSDNLKGTNLHKDILSYYYKCDDWHSYLAIPMTDNLMKIECWSKSSSDDDALYGWDWCVIDINNNTTDFKWTDDEHTSFTIMAQDKKNKSYWKEAKGVLFDAGEASEKYKSVSDFLVGKTTVKDNNSNSSKNNNAQIESEERLICTYPKENAKRAIIYAISNAQNLDAFNDDGFTYNMQKMLPYGTSSKYSMSLYKDGQWKEVDDNTWHVDNLFLKPDNDKYVVNYKLVSADVKKVGDIYKVLNCKHVQIENPNDIDKSIEKYGYEVLDNEKASPMINVPESMLGLSVADIQETTKVVETTVQETSKVAETTVQETTKKKRSLFDDPDVKMDRFIKSMCEQQYIYGYKISGLSVTEISDGVLDAKCTLKVKNAYGTWGTYTLHCVSDFNKEKIITWDVY